MKRQNTALRRLLSFALILMLLLQFAPIPIHAQDYTGDPDSILTDPTFDLTSVDPVVMEKWLKVRMHVPDENFYDALKEAAGVADVDGLTRNDVINLSGTLDLTNKGIKDLTGAEYLINVDTLILTNNKISSLDPLKNLYRLRLLDVSYNSLKSVSGTILEIESLEEFHAEHNKITEVTAPGTISYLKRLNLRYNELTQMPALNKFNALETIEVSDNKLTSLDLSENLATTLVSIDASRNEITSTSSFAGYTVLSFVNLNENHLTAFPQALRQLWCSKSSTCRITLLKRSPQRSRHFPACVCCSWKTTHLHPSLLRSKSSPTWKAYLSSSISWMHRTFWN